MPKDSQHPFVTEFEGEIYHATYRIEENIITVSSPELRKITCAELNGTSPLAIAKSLVIEMIKSSPDGPSQLPLRFKKSSW